MKNNIKSILNFPGYYIDIQGNVYSSWKCKGKGYGKGFKYYVSNDLKILKLHEDKDGYLQISLHKNNKSYTKKVHRLVLENFVGPCPKEMEACHNDGNKINNNLDNLRWDTPSNNIKDTIKHGTRVNNTGENNGRSKLNQLQVRIIRKYPKYDGYQVDLSEIFNVSVRQVSRIVNNESWSNLP